MAYISVYVNYNITPIFVWPIIFISYYLMIVKGRVEPVLFLILGSKFITGFAIPTNTSAFFVVNILVNYLPVLLILVLHSFKWGNRNVIGRYKFTLGYLFLALLYSIPYPDLALQLLVKEYFPVFLFVITAGVFIDKINYNLIISFLKPLLIVSLLIYIIPGRFETNVILNTLPLLNRVPTQETIDFISLDVFRNAGFFWDTRTMGIICYIFIYLSLTKVKSNLNLFIGVVVLLSTLSRGAIGIGGMLIFTYVFTQIIRGFYIKPLIFGVVIAIFGFAIVTFEVVEVEDHFFQSFLLTSDDGALSQRAGFREYSLEHFYDNPMGSGVGFLKGVGPIRNIPIQGGTFDTVNDAFLFSKLGELGLLGFLLFLLSLREIILKKDLYSLTLFIGILIQLLGTDLPDMKQFYFVFLVLLSSLNLKSGSNIKVKYSAKEKLYESNKDFS